MTPARPGERVLRTVSRLLCSTRFGDLPRSTVDAAKRIVLDDLGAVFGGADDEAVSALVSGIAEAGAGTATVLAPPWPRTSTNEAAMINGIAGTVLDFDGGYRLAPSHGGMYCLPAGLAVAESMHRTGSDLLTAIVVGYELGARLAEATTLRELMHPHGLWSVPAAAACVAKLEQLDEEMTERALAIAASLTIGTSYRCAFEGATVRNAWAGWSGAAGIMAVRLAKAGVTGLEDALEDTFGHLYGRFDADMVTASWGGPYAVERHYHKRYACEGHCQVAVEVLDGLREKYGFAAENIDRIEVITYPIAALRSRVHVNNPLAAKYSIPFALATLLVTGHAGPSAFASAALSDERIKALAMKVLVAEDGQLGGDDRASRPARVRVHLKGGSVVEQMGTNPPGDFRRPATTAELRQKFRGLVGPLLGVAKAAKLETRVLALDQILEVGALTLEFSRADRQHL